MLLVVSIFVIVFYSILLYIASKNANCSLTSGLKRCIPMSYGMVMSTLLGLIVTFIYPNDLAVTTVVSILISFVVIAVVSSPYGIEGILEGLGSSFMGAMMGAMLAVMVPMNRDVFTIIAMDVFFILFMAILLYVLRKHSSVYLQNRLFVLNASLVVICTAIGLTIATITDVTTSVPSSDEPVEMQHNHH